jgi:hypothetical protein
MKHGSPAIGTQVSLSIQACVVREKFPGRSGKLQDGTKDCPERGKEGENYRSQMAVDTLL